jgi:hypothetical protein
MSDKVHTCEFEPEDKVVILSAEQLLPGFLDPYQYLNISLYIQATALLSSDNFSRSIRDSIVPPANDMAEIIGQDPDLILKWTGLDQINEKALLIYTYFYFREKLKEDFPDAFVLMEKIFGFHALQ